LMPHFPPRAGDPRVGQDALVDLGHARAASDLANQVIQITTNAAGKAILLHDELP
jgi:hypothetical protein